MAVIKRKKTSVRSISPLRNINYRGFTIVELLVMIVIIGILASLSIISYTGISRKATIATIQSDIDSAYKKFKLYAIENSGYPTGIELNCITSVDPAKICLRPSPNNQYSLTTDNSNPSNQTFCLTVLNTAINTSYYITHNGVQSLGACPYTLTLIAGANGTVNEGGSFDPGSTQTITATPNATYEFSSWTGDAGCSGTASHTIVMDSNKTCIASFALVTYNLTTIAGANGTVSAGGTFNSGSSQTITATPNINYEFSSWTGDAGCSGTASHTITMDGNKTCTANFVASGFTLTTIAGTGGTVSAGGSFSPGSTQTITATPSNVSYTFNTWTGDTGCSGTASHTITMDGNKTCTANFTPNTNWIPGTAGTALDGKFVYYADAPGTYSWADRDTGCAAGGRAPTITELQAIYANKASYGSFNIAFFWSSTPTDAVNAKKLYIVGGAVSDHDKMSAIRVRCVAD